MAISRAGYVSCCTVIDITFCFVLLNLMLAVWCFFWVSPFWWNEYLWSCKCHHHWPLFRTSSYLMQSICYLDYIARHVSFPVWDIVNILHTIKSEKLNKKISIFLFSSTLLFSIPPGVGKSCLLLRFSDGSFTTSFITTIGWVFFCQVILWTAWLKYWLMV